MADDKVKDPTPELRALHCSLSGRRIVKVRPVSGKVSIGDKTWTVDASCLAPPGKEKWDIILVEGRGRAISFNPDLENPSPEEWDQATHNNLLEQIHALSKVEKTPAMSWIQIGMLALTILAVIGAGVKNANDAKAINQHLAGIEAALTAGGYHIANDGSDTTVVPANGAGGGGH